MNAISYLTKDYSNKIIVIKAIPCNYDIVGIKEKKDNIRFDNDVLYYYNTDLFTSCK